MNNLIFVYGTLKSTSWNHGLIRHCHKVCDHTVMGFQLVQNRIPFMIRTNNPEDRVSGEVYEMDDRTVASCDQFEGHPDWYRREIISRSKDGEQIQGYVYISFISSRAVDCPKNELGAFVFLGDED